MVVMVVVGSWLLRHVSTVGIVYNFYKFTFGLNIHASKKKIFALSGQDKIYYMLYLCQIYSQFILA